MLTIVLGAFMTWNWHLAVRGKTAIEHMGMKRPKTAHTQIKFDYSHESIKHNLQEIFGEFDYLYEMYLPSVRNLMSNGVIWESRNKYIENKYLDEHEHELSSLNYEEEL
jgi:hypothetical protein